MPKLGRAISEVALFYPSGSVSRQVRAWARGRTDCAVEAVFERSFPGMHEAIRGAQLVIVDATRDYPQAMEAFSQALAHLGAEGTAVYTERMHEGLELFVRLHGSLLLLGPLSAAEWEGFFDKALQSPGRRRAWGLVA